MPGVISEGSGPRVGVIMQNPSCPDDARGSRTFANVMWLLGPDGLGASAVTMLNVAPHRAAGRDFCRLDQAAFQVPQMCQNLQQIQRAINHCDVVIAAWGTGYRRLTSTARCAFAAHLRQLEEILVQHRDVRQVGNIYHPVVWKQRRARRPFSADLRAPSAVDVRPWGRDGGS
jgi:hypothetical protein